VARYRINELKRTGVKVELGKEVNLADVYRLNPEVVVVATGAVPCGPYIPGSENMRFVTSFDILLSKTNTGKKSIVIGGNKEGLTVAEFIAENGGEVIIVEASDTLGADLPVSAQVRIGDRIEENPLIQVERKSVVERIYTDRVTLQSEGKFKDVGGIDLIVSAWDRTSVHELADELLSQGKISEVYCIGDALRPREIADAIYEGALVGRTL
jgi:2,4-dienoyl-CoA reductase (NADPH2)